MSGQDGYVREAVGTRTVVPRNAAYQSRHAENPRRNPGVRRSNKERLWTCPSSPAGEPISTCAIQTLCHVSGHAPSFSRQVFLRPDKLQGVRRRTVRNAGARLPHRLLVSEELRTWRLRRSCSRSERERRDIVRPGTVCTDRPELPT